jgi:hypothetical protein
MRQGRSSLRTGSLFIHGAIDDVIERDMAVFDDDADRFLRVHLVALKGGGTIDGAEQSDTQFVVEHGSRGDFDVVDDVFHSRRGGGYGDGGILTGVVAHRPAQKYEDNEK